MMSVISGHVIVSTRHRPIGRIFDHLYVHISVLQKRTNLINYIDTMWTESQCGHVFCPSKNCYPIIHVLDRHQPYTGELTQPQRPDDS